MMSHLLSRHATRSGMRWALDGRCLPVDFSLGDLLCRSRGTALAWLRGLRCDEAVEGTPMAPVDDAQEVWASGVTYLSSRMAREAESQSSDVYARVYDASRPELFFKANGWRVRGTGQSIRFRADSAWNVPEPELVLVLDYQGHIVGFSVGNDVSSRSIEGENPLYLPQAKVYDGACAIGPAIVLTDADALCDLPIRLEIRRDGQSVFEGATRTAQIKRPLEQLAEYLFRELAFPRGALLFTGTGVVPDESFTLRSGDQVSIRIGDLVLENPVE
jgi:2-dehydro-3-deoxy-D-arabinonate dehydratase